MTEPYTLVETVDRDNDTNDGIPDFIRITITEDQAARIAHLQRVLLKEDIYDLRVAIEGGSARFFPYNRQHPHGEPDDDSVPMEMDRIWMCVMNHAVSFGAKPFGDTEDTVGSSHIAVSEIADHFPNVDFKSDEIAVSQPQTQPPAATLNGQKVIAQVESRRSSHAAEFDAAPVLRGMTDDAIVDLASRNWTHINDSDPLLDAIAQGGVNADVDEFLSDMSRLLDAGEEVLWSVKIDPGEGMAFIERERPELLEQVKAATEQAAEPTQSRRAGPR